MNMIIDADGLILGRLATVAAKSALKGEEVIIINCEKAVVRGNRVSIIKEYKRRWDMGTYKGPFIPRVADRFVRRTIRGMLPYKQEKGRKALRSIKCHVGVPKEVSGKEILRIEAAKARNHAVISVADIVRSLGGKG